MCGDYWALNHDFHPTQTVVTDDKLKTSSTFMYECSKIQSKPRKKKKLIHPESGNLNNCEMWTLKSKPETMKSTEKAWHGVF